MTDEPDPQLETLLAELTEWERNYGIRYSGDPMLRSTGESNAAIEELKRRLNERGARYHWQARTRRYVLDSLGLPPGKEGEPDFGEAKEQ